MENSIDNRLIKADSTFKTWRKVPFEDRQKFFSDMAQLLLDQKEDLGKIITQEMNKPITESIAEVVKCASMMNYYAQSENILKTESVDTQFSKTEIHYVPKGVILGVMPWNYPFWQVLRFATPAILSGNTVVLKHASICFGSGDAIEKLFLEAGFPEGVFQNLKIGHQEVQQVLENPIVKAVSLTGSERAGAEVASIAGKNIKKSLLELGGSDAFIVLEDADLNTAAEVGAWARLHNCGQTCVAAKRFIIQESITDEFIPKLMTEFNKYESKDPMDKETKFSGMARVDLADELVNQYQKALEHGAKVILPLERVSDIGFRPGLIAVQEGNPILQEELFGPLGMLMVAKDKEEALQLANDIPFGLSNSVWTNTPEIQEYFIDNLESGTVNINKMTSSDPRLPFGGTKKSGYGIELSSHALREFVTAKTIMIK